MANYKVPNKGAGFIKAPSIDKDAANPKKQVGQDLRTGKTGGSSMAGK